MECNIIYILTILLTFLQKDIVEASSWSEWWQYTGVSGFEFWGVINPEWILCQRGKRQSPINVDPSLLLYDPALKHIRVSKRSASAELENVGQFVRLVLEPGTDKLINITKGPLSYRYTVHEVDFHFGTENDLGSEHMIAGISFPFEIQIVAYNSEIYGNITQARYSPNGIAIIAIFAQITKDAKDRNEQLEIISQFLPDVQFREQKSKIRQVSIHKLMPDTNHYVTYDGSFTYPGCEETVTWIIMNRPLHITVQQLENFRMLYFAKSEKEVLTKMANNFRDVQPVARRTIRTNINFPNYNENCTMKKDTFYEENATLNETIQEGKRIGNGLSRSKNKNQLI